MKANSTLSEIEIRVKHISELLIKGVAYLDIMLLADEWGVTRRTIANYLSKAKELIIKSNETTIEVESNKLKARYEMLFHLALENQDLRTATKVLELQSKMFGISEPKEDNSKDTTLIISHQFVSGDGSVLPSNAFVDNGDGSDFDFSI